MAKVSRPVIYTCLFAVAAYAVFVVSNPAPTATKHHKRVSTQTADALPEGIIASDYTAHFVRYTSIHRDAFAAAVTVAKPSAAAASPLDNGKQGSYTLTGISAIDGATTALLENEAGDSAFLKVGDTWNGLHVVSIGNGAVAFANALGQKTRLTFQTTAPDTTAKSADNGPPSLPTGPQLPSLPNGPLVPMPIQPLPPLGRRGR